MANRLRWTGHIQIMSEGVLANTAYKREEGGTRGIWRSTLRSIGSAKVDLERVEPRVEENGRTSR